MIEVRDNGDLHFIAANGDPIAKLQLGEPAVMVNINPHGEYHPLNTRAEMLSGEDVETLRRWCEAVG